MDSGAHFHRCDFQVHTPRDTNWKGPRPSPGDDRRHFADRLVAACRQRGITAIGITDHHDFTYVDIVRQAAAAELDDAGAPRSQDDRLVVFPGLELTLGVPCQAILLLDADFPAERLTTVLEFLSVELVADDVDVLPPVVRLDHFSSLKQLHEELDRNSWLRGAYIVLPNVTDHGHGTLMRTGMQVKYKEMPCVGGYIDGSVDAIGEGNRTKFDGFDLAWGNKPLAVFQTSDARDDAFADLGKHSTWVKWATPTAEALRQACLARESRISHAAPALPNLVITRLSVSNSKFMGPIELELNSQYNAIIGGRGTGKSTCLEYLRWALCDQASAGSDEDELPDHAVRRQRLIAQTLATIDGHVDVHFVVNGIAHLVRRYAKSGDVLLRVGTEDLVPSHPDDVRALLPVEAYSQRQLSSVAVRLDELTRFVTAPIRQELADLATREETLAGQTRANSASLERYRSLTRALGADEVWA